MLQHVQVCAGRRFPAVLFIFTHRYLSKALCISAVLPWEIENGLEKFGLLVLAFSPISQTKSRLLEVWIASELSDGTL